jgi:hypothetical protein
MEFLRNGLKHGPSFGNSPTVGPRNTCVVWCGSYNEKSVRETHGHLASLERLESGTTLLHLLLLGEVLFVRHLRKSKTQMMMMMLDHAMVT